MIASGQAREAISKCKSVLEQLGETIPAHVDSNVYAEEVQHVKQSLKDMSVDDLLGLPLMTDATKLVRVTRTNSYVAYHLNSDKAAFFL